MVRLLGRVSLSLFLLVALVFSGAVVYAQTGQGTLTGSVTDSTGALIPAAAVVVKNQNTGFMYNAVTTRGRDLPCPVPECRLCTKSAIEAAGFKKLVRNDIPIRSTETLGLDVTMEVGNVVESVEVSAGAQLLETETSTTGHLVSGTELITLPTPQMKIESMLWYVSGVTSQSGNGHAAGGRSRAFQMTTDGVSATSTPAKAPWRPRATLRRSSTTWKKSKSSPRLCPPSMATPAAGS